MPVLVLQIVTEMIVVRASSLCVSDQSTDDWEEGGQRRGESKGSSEVREIGAAPLFLFVQFSG